MLFTFSFKLEEETHQLQDNLLVLVSGCLPARIHVYRAPLKETHMCFIKPSTKRI